MEIASLTSLGLYRGGAFLLIIPGKEKEMGFSVWGPPPHVLVIAFYLGNDPCGLG